MTTILTLVAPVFGLIGLGFLIARAGWLSDQAARVLSEFAFKVAIPALLFRAMSGVSTQQVSPLWLVCAYALAVTSTWLVASTFAIAVLRRPAVDAPAIAMASCFSNGLMLGLPLIIGAFGDAAAVPVAFIVSAETMLLWLLGTLHMEFTLRALSLGAVGGILRDVATNPIVGSIALGIGWAATGFSLPGIIDKVIATLAQSALPVSLFALGMSLAAFKVMGQAGTIAMICTLKLAAYPALAFGLAYHVFALPPLWSGVLLIFTSMPVGANAFVFASRYERAVGSVSAAVAISTAIALFSVSLVLALLQAFGFAGPG